MKKKWLKKKLKKKIKVVCFENLISAEAQDKSGVFSIKWRLEFY